jgi:hypothetical protein
MGTADGGYQTPAMVHNWLGEEMRLGMYWDYDAEEWSNMHDAAFPEAHAISVAPVDWDGDGDLDLIQGTSDGEIFLRKNLGSPSKIKFAAEVQPIMVGEYAMKTLGHHAMVLVADWDQDGLWDLLIASDQGDVEFFPNLGKAGKPKFVARVGLLPTGERLAAIQASTKQPTIRHGNVHVAVGDLNGDGKLDLVVGEHSSIENPQGSTPEKEAKFKELMAEFEKCHELRTRMHNQERGEAVDPPVTDEETAYIYDLYERLGAVMPQTETRTQVWFYARK